MIEGQGALVQTLLGTLLTWGLTAAGAAVVVVIHGTQRKLLDASLGFAGGVMIAASYWSLLAPAIELAEESKTYGENGEFAFVPVGVGFFFGGLFVYLTDVLISSFGLCAPHLMLVMENDVRRIRKKDDTIDFDSHKPERLSPIRASTSSRIDEMNGRRRTISNSHHQQTPNSAFYVISNSEPINLHQSRSGTSINNQVSTPNLSISDSYTDQHVDYRRPSSGLSNDSTHSSLLDQWKRIVLLIVAITVHNIPEGLAVGVGFGAIGTVSTATFESARNLAIGIGIQNFPEGLAVSLPLRTAGFSIWRSFWYGQLSGMVEPIFGILGALAVSLAKPILPYALSFAAGAMIYVVVDDIIPEANSSGNGKLASWGSIMGFLVMMVLDVGLG